MPRLSAALEPWGRELGDTIHRAISGLGPEGRRDHPARVALLLAGGYAVTAIGWLLISAVLLWSDIIRSAKATTAVIANGTLFVAFTTTVLFVVIYRYLKRLRESEVRFIEAQTELRQKDLAVRQGYVDVLDAVTGGKLILMTEDEVRATIGTEVMRPRPFDQAREISIARRRIAECLEDMGVRDRDALMLAISEALTNAIKHGGRGEYGLYRSNDCLQVVVRDFGSGIDFRELPKATLIQGFSTTSTMGMGFTIMLEVADRVLLTTDANGTIVVLEVEIDQTLAPGPERSLAEILAAV